MASVSWDYRATGCWPCSARRKRPAPPRRWIAACRWRTCAFATRRQQSVVEAAARFRRRQKVYIQFPAGIAQGELPPLFVIGPEGDGQLVNYRFRSPYYIVDRLFGAAELRLGGDKGDVVRIERTGWRGTEERP